MLAFLVSASALSILDVYIKKNFFEKTITITITITITTTKEIAVSAESQDFLRCLSRTDPSSSSVGHHFANRHYGINIYDK